MADDKTQYGEPIPAEHRGAATDRLAVDQWMAGSEAALWHRPDTLGNLREWIEALRPTPD